MEQDSHRQAKQRAKIIHTRQYTCMPCNARWHTTTERDKAKPKLRPGVAGRLGVRWPCGVNQGCASFWGHIVLLGGGGGVVVQPSVPWPPLFIRPLCRSKATHTDITVGLCQDAQGSPRQLQRTLDVAACGPSFGLYFGAKRLARDKAGRNCRLCWPSVEVLGFRPGRPYQQALRGPLAGKLPALGHRKGHWSTNMCRSGAAGWGWASFRVIPNPLLGLLAYFPFMGRPCQQRQAARFGRNQRLWHRGRSKV